MISALAVLAFAATAFGQARWITVDEPAGVNSWICFSKSVHLDNVPSSVQARIAVDSKYWLRINGEEVIFEGGLKRGPNPSDTYCDLVELAPFLHSGDNNIELLLWYFGKSGFSHNSSGKAGLFFDAPAIGLKSDSSWLSGINRAYGTTSNPAPNYRLPESNIRYDARFETVFLRPSVEVCEEGGQPWGKLVERPIPQFRNFGVKDVEYTVDGDRIVARLPYNMQFTPVIELNSKYAGELIDIKTNHSFAGATWNVRAEYVTKAGEQSYESLGWMNGEELWLTVPKGVEIKRVAYRESGYDTEYAGSFNFDDEFFNRFWQKGVNTLYINMRDNFFDCPDRERAQWWGDVVVLSGECFYTLSPSVDKLIAKAIRELCDWKTGEGVLHSPVPTGIGISELPGQMLAAISLYGFWNYYMNTGDREVLEYAYPSVKGYLKLWKQDSNGLTEYRKGGWNWGDWGDEKDMRLIYAGWHSLALQSAEKMARELGHPAEAKEFAAAAARLKKGFNLRWKDGAYRSDDYKGRTDDRVQALAVLAGIAGKDKYPQIFNTLRKEEHASPYFEKYVMEALFRMGYGEYALERDKKRFSDMVNNTQYSTLFEGWDIGNAKFGGGTTNHAWSGGTITVIGAELCGIRPTAPGWTEFTMAPAASTSAHSYSISIPTVKGDVKSSWQVDGRKAVWTITVPEGTRAKVTAPGQSGFRTYSPGTYTINCKVAE